MKRSSRLVAMLVSLFFTQTLFAQISNDSLRAQLVRDWERAKLYTQEYLDAMPDDKYNWRPVDSIRSFSEQMLHLAQANAGLVANALGTARIFPGRIIERSTSAHTRDSVVYYVNRAYDYAIEGIKNADMNVMGEMIKRGNLNESRLSWLMKAFEHQTHHRGQTTIYIRLQGIKPPAERLF